MNRIIVAFAGSKGSGKTTAFSEVESTLKNVKEITLAGTLKQACCDVFGFDKDRLFDQAYKEAYLDETVILDQKNLEKLTSYFNVEVDYDKHIRPHVGKTLDTVRETLQYVGTEVLHPIDKLIHVKAAVTQLPEEGIAVITDLRFEQEFDYFNDNFDEFFPFYIKNNNAELAASGDKHPSETQLHNFKHKCKLIDNNNSIGDFRKAVVNEVKSLL